MKIKDISFITPLEKTDGIKLDKDYSQTLVLSESISINLAANIGPKTSQQDSVAITENNGYTMLLVADGVGGLEKGEEASYKTAKVLKEWVENQSLETLENLDELQLEEIITELIIYMQKNIIPNESGTTLNMSIIGPEKTFIINVGDSRTYSIKNEKIKLRTRDDSLAFIKLKPKTAEQRDRIRFYKRNNIITNYIGKNFVPVVVTTTLDNEEYDILCHVTDGISDILSEDSIRRRCLSQNPAESLIREVMTTEYVNEPTDSLEYYEYIIPHDNAAAVVYTKKLKPRVTY